MRETNDNHKILILGGGYAGIMAASRLLINGVRADITLVDARTELVQRIRLHETLAGSTPRTLPYRLLERRGIRFVQAWVEALEPGRRRVQASTPGGERLEMEYDTLIFALGSRTAAPAPGLAAVRLDDCVSALPMGAHVGENVARVLQGREPKPFPFAIVIRCVSLGRKDGLVQFTAADDAPTGRVWTRQRGRLTKGEGRAGLPLPRHGGEGRGEGDGINSRRS